MSTVPWWMTGGRVSHKAWSFLLNLLLSAAIETIQYFTGFGLAELVDIISNGLGGLIGFGLGYARKRLINS